MNDVSELELPGVQRRISAFAQSSEVFRSQRTTSNLNGVWGSLAVLVVSVGVGARGLVSGSGYFTLVAGIVVILSILSLIYFSLAYFAAVSSRTTLVRCPTCESEHEVYMDTREFVCTTCRTLLMSGQLELGTPEFVSCGYCGLPTATTEQRGTFECPNCGVERKWGDNNIQGDTVPCKNCEQEVSTQAKYCKHCRETLKVPDNVDYGQTMLVQAGMNAEGWLQEARALLRMITDNVDSDEFYFPRILLHSVLEAVVEALEDTELTHDVQDLLPKIDIAYSYFLKSLLWQLVRRSRRRAQPMGSRKTRSGVSSQRRLGCRHEEESSERSGRRQSTKQEALDFGTAISSRLARRHRI